MKQLLLLSLTVIFYSSNAQIEENIHSNKTFDGPFIGINVGIQNVFGGSFVNGMDVLAQESRFVSELSFGFRKQFFSCRLVAGLEFHIGLTDGQLSHQDPQNELFINYENSFQNGKGIIIGYSPGKRKNNLLFFYLNETKRKFDVDIRQMEYRFSQTDKQGMLKYGVGFEKQLTDKINLRATVGKLNVDFGELQTNIDVEDKFDFTLGATYNF